MVYFIVIKSFVFFLFYIYNIVYYFIFQFAIILITGGFFYEKEIIINPKSNLRDKGNNIKDYYNDEDYDGLAIYMYRNDGKPIRVGDVITCYFMKTKLKTLKRQMMNL